MGDLKSGKKIRLARRNIRLDRSARQADSDRIADHRLLFQSHHADHGFRYQSQGARKSRSSATRRKARSPSGWRRDWKSRRRNRCQCRSGPASWSTPKARRVRRKCGGNNLHGSITLVNSRERSSASPSSTIPGIRSIPPTGTPAATDCSRPISSGNTISTTTRHGWQRHRRAGQQSAFSLPRDHSSRRFGHRQHR